MDEHDTPEDVDFAFACLLAKDGLISPATWAGMTLSALGPERGMRAVNAFVKAAGDLRARRQPE